MNNAPYTCKKRGTVSPHLQAEGRRITRNKKDEIYSSSTLKREAAMSLPLLSQLFVCTHKPRQHFCND